MQRDAALSFAQDELAPWVIAAYHDEAYAPKMFPMMGEAGLMRLTIP